MYESNILPTVTFWIFYHAFLCLLPLRIWTSNSPEKHPQQEALKKIKFSSVPFLMNAWCLLRPALSILLSYAPQKLTTWTCGIVRFTSYCLILEDGSRGEKKDECIKKIKPIKAKEYFLISNFSCFYFPSSLLFTKLCLFMIRKSCVIWAKVTLVRLGKLLGENT